MDKRLTLELVTPERSAFSGEADFVTLPAWEGEMGILPGHAPFVVQLAPGEVRLTNGDDRHFFAVSGGFAEIKDDKVSVFAETAELADVIDEERARQALERAQADLKRTQTDAQTLAQAQASMKRALVRLKVVQGRRKKLSR